MPENGSLDSNPTEADHSQAGGVGRRKRANPILRLGCGALIGCWFILLMLPCALFYLAANGEIRLWHGDVPQPHSHPLLLISLVSAAESRGLRIENSSIVASGDDETSLCVQTDVRFVLWESDENGDQDVSYCDCYWRADTAADWRLDRTFGGGCRPTEQGAAG